MRLSALLICLALALTSCSSEVGVERWDPFDYEDFTRRLDQPNGVLVNERVEELATRAQQLREVITTLHALFVLVGDAAKALEGFRADDALVEGTNLFAEVACPGPDLLDRATEFEYGRIRLESPGMLLEAAVAWRMEGDILMSFEDCRFGPYVLRGESPAWRDPETDALALDLSFEIVRVDANSPVEVRLPILYDAQAIRVLVTLPSGDYALDFDAAGGLLVRLIGSDSQFGCDLSQFPPQCSLI